MQFNASPDIGNGGSQDLFVKLKDKESIVGVFRGQPYEFRIHWVDKRSKPCLPPCELCDQKVKFSFQFRLNFITRVSGNWVAKILEKGSVVYDSLKQLNEDYPLEKYAVRIIRSGSQMNDTVYTILPIPRGEVTP